MTTKTISLAELVEDFDIYPRHDVDASHVAELARAIQSGVELPLIVIDKKSKRIVDGMHRSRAWRRVLGANGEVEVELRSYSSEVEIVKDAILSNSGHGKRFDSQDRTRCIIMLEKRGVGIKDIAITLSTTPERVNELRVRVVIVKGEKQPAKPIAWPATGEDPRHMTVEQYATSQSSSGWRPRQTVTQLIRELRAGVLDLTDEKLVESLWELHVVIAEVTPDSVAA